MATNQLLPFGMGESPNRLPFEDWNVLPSRLTGFQSGIASSQQFNYVLAQGALAGYLLGQLIVEFAKQDATLDSAETMYTALKNAVAKFVPNAIADKSILTAKIADLAITTAKLADGNVTEVKLAKAAVTAAKILDGAVGTAKLADAAVTNAKIAAGVIAFDRLAAAAIATQQQAEAGTANDVLMTPLRVAQLLSEQMPPAVPTGALMFFHATTPPEGWLLCNGQGVSRTTYANLFAVIGTKYGAGDGSTTFNLPNLHHRFLEGTTTTSEVGSSVQAGLPNILGSFSNGYRGMVTTTTGAFFWSEAWTKFRDWGGDGAANAYDGAQFEASRVSNIFGTASTVQPSAVRLLPCLKF